MALPSVRSRSLFPAPENVGRGLTVSPGRPAYMRVRTGLHTGRALSPRLPVAFDPNRHDRGQPRGYPPSSSIFPLPRHPGRTGARRLKGSRSVVGPQSRGQRGEPWTPPTGGLETSLLSPVALRPDRRACYCARAATPPPLSQPPRIIDQTGETSHSGSSVNDRPAEDLSQPGIVTPK